MQHPRVIGGRTGPHKPQSHGSGSKNDAGSQPEQNNSSKSDHQTASQHPKTPPIPRQTPSQRSHPSHHTQMSHHTVKSRTVQHTPKSSSHSRSFHRAGPTPFPISPKLPITNHDSSSHNSATQSSTQAPGAASPVPAASSSAGQNATSGNDSNGLSSGDIAAAAVVPVVVVLVAIVFAFIFFRRRQNRIAARDEARRKQEGQSTPMAQGPFYARDNSAGAGQQDSSSTAYGHQTTAPTQAYAAVAPAERDSGSFERRMKEASLPAYLPRNNNNSASRLDSSNLLPSPPVSRGGSQDPFGDPRPANTSFAQSVFTENPGFLPGEGMQTSNRTSSPTLGLEGGLPMGRPREDDEVSAISEEEDAEVVEYGEGAETGEAGTAQRHRASMIDMSPLGTPVGDQPVG